MQQPVADPLQQLALRLTGAEAQQIYMRVGHNPIHHQRIGIVGKLHIDREYQQGCRHIRIQAAHAAKCDIQSSGIAGTYENSPVLQFVAFSLESRQPFPQRSALPLPFGKRCERLRQHLRRR